MPANWLRNVLSRCFSSKPQTPRSPWRRFAMPLCLETLEDRLAPAVGIPLQTLLEPSATLLSGPATNTAPAGIRSVVFFESSVANWQTLSQGLTAGTAAVLLDANGNGLDEMAAFLQGRHGLSTIDLVAHGSAGQIDLGTTTLNAASLGSSAAQLATIGGALGKGGELDLWSCDSAAGSAGAAFVQELSATTGAAVAAADHLVGSAALGGSWQLDVRTEGAEGAIPFTTAAIGAFQEVLDGWSAAGSLATARQQATATLLGNGKVLVAGGYGNSGVLSSAELYDPVSNTWSAAGSLTTGRYQATATLLGNGKVLVAGGSGNSGYLSSAELYDPVSNTWSAAGSLATGRYSATATLLGNGKVLVAGGFGNSGYLSSAELYDPVSNTWSAAGSLTTGRYQATATLLGNGKVLVAGGYSNNNGVLSSAELYDPVNNTWSAAGSLTTGRYQATATLLGNGKVLVAGGSNGNYLSSAELYDPVNNTWSAAGSLTTGRYQATATLLGNGKVLVAGGFGNNGYGYLSSAELYDPVSNTWSAAGSLTTGRYQATATLLNNGEVLVAGGVGNNGFLSSAELFEGLLAYTSSSSASYTLRLDGTGSNLQVVDGSNNILATRSLASTYEVFINGHAGGGDTLTIDYGNGYFSLPGGIIFEGGSTNPGVNGSNLIIQGGSFNTITDNATGPGAGNLVLTPNTGTASTIVYGGLAPILVSSSAKNVTVILPSSAQSDILEDSGTSGRETILSSTNSFAALTFTDPTGTLTVNSNGSAVEKLTVQSLDSSFAASLALVFQSNNSDEIDFTGAQTLGGGNSITANAPTITDSGAPLTVTGGGSITFNAGNSLVLAASLTATGGGTIGLYTAGGITQSGGTIGATGAVTFNASGNIGSSGSPIEFDATNTPTGVGIYTSGSVYLDGQGSLVLSGINAYNSTAVNITARNALTLSSNSSINAGTGTISLAADANADGTADNNPGALSILSGAEVFSANTSANAITLRGASLVSASSFAVSDNVGTLQLVMSGDVGSSAAPLYTDVAQLGTSTVGGNLYLSNDISLTTTGTLRAASLSLTQTFGDFTTHNGDLHTGSSSLAFTQAGNDSGFNPPQHLTTNGQTITNLSHTSISTLIVNGALTLGGNLTNADGAGDINITRQTVTIAGNWSWGNSGLLDSSYSTVVFAGTNQSISGNTSFYNLTKTVTSPDILTFQADSTQSFAGVLTLKGSAGNLLSLRSSTPGSQWTINPLAYRSVSYVDVQDSFNLNAAALSAANATDSGDNLNWVFGSSTTVPAILGITGGAGQSVTVGASFNAFSAKVIDAFGNALSGVAVTFTAPASGPGGSFGSGHSLTDTELTNASGFATTSQAFTANTTAGSFVVTASAGLLTALSQLTNTAGTPTTLTPWSATTESTTVGTAYTPLRVQVLDAFGNPVSNSNVTFSVVPSGNSTATFAGNASSVSVSTNANGLAVTPALIASQTAGTFMVTASVAGVASPINFVLTNTAGAAASIHVAGGGIQSTPTGLTFGTRLEAFVADAFGNPVAGVSVTFSDPTNGPTGTFNALTTVPTNALGIATAPSLKANQLQGSYIASATTPGVVGSATFSLTNTGLPATITSVAGATQSTKVNQPYAVPLQVKVTDAFGKPISGITVVFTLPGSGPSGSFTDVATAITNASGLATAGPLTANTRAGTFTVLATVAGVFTQAKFTLTNSPGLPAGIVAVAGTPASTTVGKPFTPSLQALVTDTYGNPISGVTVTFTSPATGPSGTFAGKLTTTVTALNGIATAPALTANTLAGSFAVTASTTGVSMSATYSLTNIAGPAAKVTAKAGTPQTATVGQAFATLLQVLVTDSFNNPLSGIAVTFTAPPATGPSGVFTGSSVVLSNASGIATAPALTANTKAGSFTVSATVASLTKVSFTLTNIADAPLHVTAVAGTPQSIASGSTFATALQVRATDLFGNPVSGVTVTFTVQPTGAVAATFPSPLANTATAISSSLGVATAPMLRANSNKGTFSVVASISGGEDTGVFTLTNR